MTARQIQHESDTAAQWRCGNGEGDVFLILFGLALAGQPDPPDTQFSSVGPWSAHERISKRAAKSVGWRRRYRRWLKEGANDADFEQLTLDIPAMLRLGLFRAARLEYNVVPTPRYDPGTHFDRRPDETTHDAIARGQRSIASHLETAERAAAEGREQDVLRALGLGLHGVQDLVAHSNLMDLSDAEQQVVLDAVLSGGELALDSPLVLVWYEPYAPIRVRTENRPRVRDRELRCEQGELSHFCMGLDSAGTYRGKQKITDDEGRTRRRFRVAKELAEQWSSAWLEHVASDL